MALWNRSTTVCRTNLRRPPPFRRAHARQHCGGASSSEFDSHPLSSSSIVWLGGTQATRNDSFQNRSGTSIKDKTILMLLLKLLCVALPWGLIFAKPSSRPASLMVSSSTLLHQVENEPISIWLLIPGTTSEEVEGRVKRILRTGVLISRSGSYCLPLSWLAQRPAAFTDEVYTLCPQPPTHLEQTRRRVVGLLKAAEVAAMRTGEQGVAYPRDGDNDLITSSVG